MKIKQYTAQQLRGKIRHLESLQETPHARTFDKRYLKAYKKQLQERLKDEN